MSDGRDGRPGPAEGPALQERLGLWQGYGVEIELAIVDADSLDVRSVADRLFEAVGGGVDAEIEHDGIGWSNELALHVLELKTWGPAPRLDGLETGFQRSVARADEALAEIGCRLLPGGAHPWMDPAREFRIWPHEYTDVYHAFDRIFSCRGHGWANLQSTHLNLPFGDDRELALLHEAIRLVLPLIPALAASSPILDGRVAPALDARMAAYRDNARRVPAVTGLVVPERVRSEKEYHDVILDRIYRDMAALDPEGVLRHEWVNARGAIARFQRGAIEIRVIDAQESPVADLAVVEAVTAAVRRAAALLEAEPGATDPVTTDALAALLNETVRRGRRARLDGIEWGALLDLPGRLPDPGELWAALLEPTVLRETPDRDRRERPEPPWHRPGDDPTFHPGGVAAGSGDAAGGTARGGSRGGPGGGEAGRGLVVGEDLQGRVTGEGPHADMDAGAASRRAALTTILEQGSLAERILRALGLDHPRSIGAEPERDRLRAIYRSLADTLAAGGVFRPG